MDIATGSAQLVNEPVLVQKESPGSLSLTELTFIEPILFGVP